MIFVSRFQDNSPLGKLPPPPENCCLTIKFPSKIIASTQANLPPKITTSELRKTMYYLKSTIIYEYSNLGVKSNLLPYTFYRF